MTSKKYTNLYDYLLKATSPTYNIHSVVRVFKELQKQRATLAFFVDSRKHSLVSVDEVESPEQVGAGLLLAASKLSNIPETLFVRVNDRLIADESSLLINQVFDEKKNHYWIADETGMFAEPIKLSIKSFFLIEQVRMSAMEQRLTYVQDFFDDYKYEQGKPNITNQEAYELMGSPTRETLWKKWKELWPDHFNNFQKNDFLHPPLKELKFKLGTGVNR